MRVGVLANPMLVRWQEDALRNVADLDGVGIEHVVVDASVREDSSSIKAGADVINRGRSVSLDDLGLFLSVLAEERLKALIYADEKLGWLLFGEGTSLDYLRSRPIEAVDCLSAAAFHECHPVPAGGAWSTLPEETTDLLAAECDVVLRFGFGLLEGRVLDAPEHGVLSTHGSDIRKYRGLGPKASFYNGDSTVGVTLQQLTEEIDGGRIVAVAERELPRYHTLDDAYGAVYAMQSEIYAEGIAKLMRDDFAPWEPESLGRYYGHALQQRRLGFVARLLAKNNWRRLQKAVLA